MGQYYRRGEGDYYYRLKVWAEKVRDDFKKRDIKNEYSTRVTREHWRDGHPPRGKYHYHLAIRLKAKKRR